MHIRTPARKDLPEMRSVVEESELFPVEMLAPMIAPALDSPDDTEDRWLVCEDAADRVVGLCLFRPEAFTEGTWNLLAIGFLRECRGHGYGAALVAAVEEALADQRILIVDTSGVEDFSATRKFYLKCGFTEEAVIRDYWTDGDDKVTFWKRLG